MHKILSIGIRYVYKACNPTILNLSISKKIYKLRIVGLQAQVKYIPLSRPTTNMCIFLLLAHISWLLWVLHFIGCKVGLLVHVGCSLCVVLTALYFCFNCY